MTSSSCGIPASAETAGVVTVNMDRAVHKQGMQSVYSFLLFFGGLSIAFGIVTILLLDRIVISRLYILNEGVKKIGNAQDRAIPISLPGNDELSQLAKEINVMVDSLQKSTELIRLDEEKLKQEAQEMEKKNSTLERSEETLLKVMSDLENTKDNIEKEKVQDEIMLRSWRKKSIPVKHTIPAYYKYCM
jgi:methyl-accepting chemotaxis protein